MTDHPPVRLGPGVTEDEMALLAPDEQLAFRMAAGMVARGENPGINVTARLLITIEELLHRLL